MRGGGGHVWGVWAECGRVGVEGREPNHDSVWSLYAVYLERFSANST